MKNLFGCLLFVLLMLNTSLSGQKEDFIFIHKNENVVVGQLFNAGQIISGVSYDLKDVIKKVVSKDDNVILLNTKNKIYAVNLADGELVYTIDTKSAYYTTYDSVHIYILREKELQVYDIKNGSLVTTIFGRLKHYNSEKKFAIFMDPEIKNKVTVYDFENFTPIEEFESKKEESVSQAIMAGDKTLLNWGGITMLDKNLKVDWSYDQKSSKTYNQKILLEVAAVAAAFAISGGITTAGFLYVPSLDNDPYLLYKLNSNIVSYNNNFYRASFESIDCIDSNGKKVWSTPLGPKYSSTSILFQYNDKLILLNTGTAMNMGQKIYYGETCLTTFDIHTGKQLGFNKLQSSFNTKVTDLLVNENELITIQNDGLSFFNLESGVRFKYKDSKALKAYNLKNFNSQKFYLQEGKELLPWNPDSTQICVNYGAGKILLADQNLNVLKKEKQENLCLKIGSYKQSELMLFQNYIYLVRDNKKIALLPAGNIHHIHQGNLLIFKDKKLTVVSLESLNTVK